MYHHQAADDPYAIKPMSKAFYNQDLYDHWTAPLLREEGCVDALLAKPVEVHEVKELQEAVDALQIGLRERREGEEAAGTLCKMRANCLRAALSRAVSSALERAEEAEASAAVKPRKRVAAPVSSVGNKWRKLLKI